MAQAAARAGGTPDEVAAAAAAVWKSTWEAQRKADAGKPKPKDKDKDKPKDKPKDSLPSAVAPRPPRRRTRLNAVQRARLYPLVAGRDGEFCANCGRTPSTLAEDGRSPKLCIDHISNDQFDSSLPNLQLLCRSCNTKKNHPARDPLAGDRLPGPEMTINRRAEPMFKKWLIDQFLGDPYRQFKSKTLINEAAAHCDCSQATIRRYLDKRTTDELDMYREVGEGPDRFVELRESMHTGGAPAPPTRTLDSTSSSDSDPD